MVKIRSNKKGQAAIEFLMTYGWMLLVVLIVGALIFSFVDFGSLLPNKVNLNNNIRAEPASSVAYSHTTAAAANRDQVTVSFRYNGPTKVNIYPTITTDNSSISSDVSAGSCYAVNVTNTDTGLSSFNSTGVIFLSGASGYVKFNCSTMNSNTGLIKGDSLTGTIKVYFADAKSNSIQIPSTGSLRLTITE